MLPEEQEVVKITPNPESLLITHTNSHGVYTCPEVGCSFVTSSPSMLGLHKSKVHKIKTAPDKGVIHQYYCPHSGCYYTPESGRFFKNLDVLRAHYTKVHTEKKFKCCKCNKGFGLERDCLRHQKECGQSFTCPDCNKVYDNKGALRFHCQYTGHNKPPELCPKPKPPVDKSAAKVKPQKPDKIEKHPMPILPKFSPQDKISFILPSTSSQSMTATTVLPSTISILNQNNSSQLPPPIAVLLQNNNTITATNNNGNMIQSNMPVSVIHTLSSQKLCCDNVAQTVKSLPSRTKAKKHAPTQTQLSILERAMKSSKIPITKTSKATQKSLSGSNRKRKSSDKKDAGTGTPGKKYKRSSKLTVATLTDPLRVGLSQNIGSQTVFSILYHNQQKNTAVNTSDMHLKASMSTQTSTDNPLLCLDQVGGQDGLIHPNVPYQSSYPITLQLIDSNTQTFSGMLTPVTTSQLSSSQTQTRLTRSSTSTTQTLESLALDSSTQTLDINLDDSSSLLDELFPESARISVDTQTFGCFSSDMMTQTLEQLASDASHEIGTNTFFTDNNATQTFDEMVGNMSQTFDSTTQTSLRTDITTQTFYNQGIDTMTQTLDSVASSGIGCSTQPLGSRPLTYDNLCQTEYSTFQDNYAATQTTIENNCNTTTQTDIAQGDHGFSAEILSLISENSISIQGNEISDGPASHISQSTPAVSIWNQTSGSQVQTTQTNVSEVREMALQTEDVDLWELSAQPDAYQLRTNEDNSHLNDKSCIHSMGPDHPAANPLTDSMTQTLSFPHDDMTLEALLSDMATQTFDEDDLTFDALLQSSDNLSSDLMASHNLANATCQTPLPENGTSSSSLSTTTVTDRENVWEIGTQTFDGVREMALQTESEDLWEMSEQARHENFSGIDGDGTVDDMLEIGTQTALEADGFRVVGIQSFGDELWEIGTQTGGDNAWEIGTQTGIDNAWEMGTQTGGDNEWEMGTQTGGDNAWEMGTQTGVDNAWEIGTQTGGDNAWEMGTQTGGDNAWEMGTQTGGDNAWGMGTQTGVDNAWEMGTQTGVDNAWEMGTQTAGDNSWEMGTQTRGDNAWEMGTQTAADNAWEMGTQTAGDNSWEMGTQTRGDNAWEMGTQTMDNLLMDTMTQTGDDLIDFLLTGKTG